MTQIPTPLLSEAELLAAVEAAADALAPRLENEAVLICLLTGGLWFAADLSRALSRRGLNLLFDALWLSSYGDGTESAGLVQTRAPLQRSVKGKQVLIVDDVFDTGLSLDFAAEAARAAGAKEVLTAVFASKPSKRPRLFEPDVVAWQAPDRFLVGYGLDHGGLWRGLPYVGALD